MMLDVKNLSVSFGETQIVDDVNFCVREGCWMMLVGPNGAGKSTVVNAVSCGVHYRGEIYLHGKSVDKYKSAALAREMGVLAQSHSVGYSFTVEEIVRLGRFAHSKGTFFSAPNEDDEDSVENALSLTGMSAFRRHSVLTLSGGELQRAFLAQLLAQNPKLLILDEPSNHLDLVYQKQVFDLIREWLKVSGRAVISVVHDLNLAKAYGTHALLLNRGKQVALGSVSEVLTRENLQSVYDLDVYEWMRQMLSQW